MSLMAWNISTRMHEREWLYCVPRARSASEIHIATTASAFWYWYSTTLETCTGFYMHETSPNVNSVPRDTWHRGRGFKSHVIHWNFSCLQSVPNSTTGIPFTPDGATKSFTWLPPKMAKWHPNNPPEDFQLYLVDQASKQVVVVFL